MREGEEETCFTDVSSGDCLGGSWAEAHDFSVERRIRPSLDLVMKPEQGNGAGLKPGCEEGTKNTRTTKHTGYPALVGSQSRASNSEETRL